jgi:hypothetical protein
MPASFPRLSGDGLDRIGTKDLRDISTVFDRTFTFVAGLIYTPCNALMTALENGGKQQCVPK